MNTIIELQNSDNQALSLKNQERHMNYRHYAFMIKEIYDYAKSILDSTLGPNYTLPINVKTIAEKLGLTISSKDLKEEQFQYLNSGFDCLLISELTLHKKSMGDCNTISGTIYIDKALSDFSARFSIAQQIGRFVLREEKHIGTHLKLGASFGLYQFPNTNSMLADSFALALLLPYHIFEQERINYEKNRTSWPLDFSKWIAYLRDKAWLPEYYVVLACQELKKVNICLEYEKAKESLRQILQSLDISGREETDMALELYATTINNLELWGYPKNDIAAILFRELENNGLTVIEFIHDFLINNHNNQNNQSPKREYPSKLINHIAGQLSDAGISPTGISQIIEISLDSLKKEALSRKMAKKE